MDEVEMKRAILRGARPGLEPIVAKMRFEAVERCWCGGRLEGWLPEFEPYQRCVGCGCKSVRFRPTAESLESFYSGQYWYEYQSIHECPPIEQRWENDMLDRVPHYLGWVRSLLDPPGRLLEVGCGSGRLLHELKLSGFECTAAEMDPDVAAWAAKKTGLAVYAGSFPPPAVREFDLILVIDVLEHVTDQVRFVEEAKSRLRAGGRLMVHCPVIDTAERAAELKFLFNPLSHLWMHSSRSIELLWARVGLQPVKMGELFAMPCFEVKA